MGKKNKIIMIFFGPPGSGKGTQADMIGEKLGLPVVSPGELLRHERDAGTQTGKEVAVIMAKGEMVPDETVEKILAKRLKKKDTAGGFILDGYPRRKNQLNILIKRFENILQGKDRVIAVLIDSSDQAIKKRISGRRVCDCGAAFHILHNPPKKPGICDLCGAALYQRKDDAPEIVDKRLKRYHKTIKPLLDYFEKNSEYIVVDGDQSISEVKKELMKKLKL